MRFVSRVRAGELIAHVGHWPGDPGRSHTHLGVSHPQGTAAAREHIVAVSNATHAALPA